MLFMLRVLYTPTDPKDLSDMRISHKDVCVSQKDLSTLKKIFKQINDRSNQNNMWTYK